MQRLKSVFCFSVLLTLASGAEFDDPYNYDYSYGDYSFVYDTDFAGNLPHRAVAVPGLLQSDNRVADSDHLTGDGTTRALTGLEIPLCCPRGLVYDVYRNCSTPPSGWTWLPSLSGEPNAAFYFKGFPHCKEGKPIPIYQKEVLFDDRDAFVPRYIQLEPVPPEKYCVTKVYDSYDPEDCDTHQTKVWVCVEKKRSRTWTLLDWSSIGASVVSSYIDSILLPQRSKMFAGPVYDMFPHIPSYVQHLLIARICPHTRHQFCLLCFFRSCEIFLLLRSDAVV